jgi:hypothetical protein
VAFVFFILRSSPKKPQDLGPTFSAIGAPASMADEIDELERRGAAIRKIVGMHH